MFLKQRALHVTKNLRHSTKTIDKWKSFQPWLKLSGDGRILTERHYNTQKLSNGSSDAYNKLSLFKLRHLGISCDRWFGQNSTARLCSPYSIGVSTYAKYPTVGLHMYLPKIDVRRCAKTVPKTLRLVDVTKTRKFVSQNRTVVLLLLPHNSSISCFIQITSA